MANDMLSQEEIDALLKGSMNFEPEVEYFEADEYLTEMERDALGEIGNISMGTAATTLSTLLNRKVNITTPSVSITTTDMLAEEYSIPFVAIDVSYKDGLEGSNVLILNTDDVKIISDIMMGRDSFDTSREISDLDLSAVSEAMNQMMGSACTSLSEMFSRKIDIKPPQSMVITFQEGKEKIELLKKNEPIIKVSFKMVVEDIINSNIMQLIPIEFGKFMVDALMNGSVTDIEKELEDLHQSSIDLSSSINEEPISINPTTVDIPSDINYNISKNEEKVVVKKPVFQSFSTTTKEPFNTSIDLIGDIPVEITVELGRTHKKISEILELGQGSVIELDKLVGEPLNIYANGKFIAKGEVVVIDDSFGVRVTEIESSSKKII